MSRTLACHQWWAWKLRRNRERDAQTVAHWQNQGWDVIVFWKHETPEDVARPVEEVLIAKFVNTASKS